MRLLVLLAFLLLAGCAPASIDDRPREVGVVEEVGSIEYIELEGGFYGITTEGGARFYPVDLPDEFMRAGIRVRFRGRVQEGMVTIRMWGTPISIERMEEV